MLILGGLIGAVVTGLMRHADRMVPNIVLGIAGALLGSWILGNLFQLQGVVYYLSGVIGAVVMLALGYFTYPRLKAGHPPSHPRRGWDENGDD